jgi:hypothetical protein
VAEAGWSAAVVAASMLWAGATFAGDEMTARPALLVNWHDPALALPFAHEVLAGDVRAVLDGAGVDLEWEMAGPEAVIAGAELHVVLLGAERAGPTDVMGSVHPGSLSRTAWINLPGVERTLGLRRLPGGGLAPRSEPALSRALARVIAHELVHLLAPELPHAGGGLMAPRLGRSFLTDPRVALSEPVAAAVRRGASSFGPTAGPRLASVGSP